MSIHGSRLDDDLLGMFSPTESRIYFDLRLTPIERRSVIAHELGHAYYGHECDNRANERQANIYAARLLIEPEAYARAEVLSSNAHDIADELGVLEILVSTYREHCLHRVGDTTYTDSRMGAGQWLHRFETAPAHA
ncbi:ImmA/IrrE family metallo-endopeptidase [Agromyces atrinae]|uniref:ImmA/IrrE family metallo-endopeptidase n=1 Tax=Agromyces atrinae TaxID=592376 RepID=UPI001F594C30|nr:ImmA/IrrE family metallo-endopeptidase [Agromyces atrinae]MCI2958182.1 ImmA/IrrE family metallo-endopeptidase [Agromyces atrinae]